MKKAFILSFLSIFLFINSGIAVTAHWCGNKLSSIDFFYTDKAPCKCGKKAMKAKCCKDKTAILKANEELARSTTLECNIEALTRPSSLFNGTNLQLPYLSKANTKLEREDIFYKPKIPIYLMDGVLLI